MPNTVRHKHTGISPSHATSRATDVDGANWLEEHQFQAPETGAVLIGDTSVSDQAGWVLTGSVGFVLTSQGVGMPPVWSDPLDPSGGMTNPMTAVGDLIVGGIAGAAARLAIVPAGAILVSGATPAWSTAPALTGLTLTGFTQGSMLFMGAAEAIAQDNANFFYDDANNNLHLFGGLVGTGGVKVLALGPGTTPTTSPADTVQGYVKDDAAQAGSASLFFRTERGDEHKLYGVSAASGFAVTRTSATAYMFSDGSAIGIGSATNHNLRLYVNSVSRMTFNAAGGVTLTGRLTITEPTPGTLPLYVQGLTVGGGNYLFQVDAGGSSVRLLITDDATNPLFITAAAAFRAVTAGPLNSGGAGWRMLVIAN